LSANGNEVVEGPVRQCQACFSADLQTIRDFQPQPPVQAFLRAEQLDEPETHYPLSLLRCDSCGLIQLGYAPPPEVVFPPEYPYQSGMTRILVEDFRDLANQTIERLGLGSDDLAVDIGSNDGTLLQGFRERGIRVVGVEPTGIAKIAEKNGVPTVNAFITEAVAEQIVAEHGHAKVVTAANVIAHTNNLYPMLRAISSLLDESGMFVSESHYLLPLVEGLQFDTIYHEHLRFYALEPLIGILERAGFTVVDASRVPTHGGSIRVWASTQEGERSARLEELLAAEREAGLHRADTYEQFGRRITEWKQSLLELLLRIRREGGTVAGIGAPARASMLVNTCHVDNDLVAYVCEPPGSLKNGLYVPGARLPIVDEARLYAEQPEYALMLSWHIADELMPKIRANGFRGKFIVPLPEPRVVDEV
jgi:hypothetical protein